MSILNEVKILYEDNDVLVINKPAGLAVHADGRTEEKTLADWVLTHYPEMKDVGEQKIQNEELEIKNQELNRSSAIPRPGIVHRIDRDTSGALILRSEEHTSE